jgi:hypothetical protein
VGIAGATLNWTDHGGTSRTYQVIHADNMKDLEGNNDPSVGHIGERGALRLAKALWWMLARMAGWDGTPANALILRGSPTDQTVRLDWELNASLPGTATWRITYTGPTSGQIENIPLATRAYTLTGLTNYAPYTFTLNAMDNGSPVLTQTIQVMPTDRSVYLPLTLK